MTPVLTFDVGGPDEMNVECQRIGHAAPRKVGDRGYSASGSEWPQIRDELMVVPFVTVPLPWTQIATIRDLFALAARVNCAGDGFNKPGTIVCSGDLTDELDTTADRGVITGTLFEIGSSPGYTPSTTLFLLTSVESPDSGGDPTILVSTPDGPPYPGDASIGITLGSGLTPPTATCPATPALIVSSTPEYSHLSVPLNAGIATGSPAIRFETGTVNGTVWNTSSVMAKLSLVRAGSVVAGPWDSSWGSMGVITGNTDTITFGVTFVLPIQTGDQFLIEWYARIGLACGQVDNAQRPFIYVGAVPGPRLNPLLFVGGVLTSYP